MLKMHLPLHFRRIAPVHSRLRHDTDQLAVPPDLEPCREHLARALAYHQLMVREALHLAFSVTPNPSREPLRARFTGLGAPADLLPTLAEELRSQLAARENTP